MRFAIMIGLILCLLGSEARSHDTHIALSVKDHGAVGDGITDDRNAIQSAINYAACCVPSTGAPVKRVYFPPGIYRLSSPVTLLSGVELYGAGAGRSILKRLVKVNVPVDPVVAVYNEGEVAIRNLTIDGDRDQVGEELDPLVLVSGAHAVTIEDVEIRDSAGHGIDIRSNTDAAMGSRTIVRRSSIRNSKLYGISLLDASNVTVEQNVIVASGWDGVAVHTTEEGTSRDIVIAGNNASKSQRHGISAYWSCPVDSGSQSNVNIECDPSDEPDLRAGVEALVIQGNTAVDNCLNGFIIQAKNAAISGNVARANVQEDADTDCHEEHPGLAAGFTLNGEGIAFSGNVSADNLGMGVDVGFCRHCSITGNVIRDNSSLGIEINVSRNVVVDGNVLVGNVRQIFPRPDQEPADAGIYVHGGACMQEGDQCMVGTSSVVISDNIVRKGSSTNQTFGIRVLDDDGLVERVFLRGNDVAFAGTGGSDLSLETSSVFERYNFARDTLLGSSIYLDPPGDALVVPQSGDYFVVAAGTTALRTIDSTTWRGRRLTLAFAGARPVLDMASGGNLQLRGNLSATDETVLQLVYDGSLWVETSR